MTVKRLVIGNWKMNTTLEEAVAIAQRLAEARYSDDTTVGVAPPFPWIHAIGTVLVSSDVLIGAQTCAATPNGAFTGEVSASMVAEVCDFVLVGHSERRALFGETNDVVAAKLHRAIDAGLAPVLCVGETLEQRLASQAERIVTQQLKSALQDFTTGQLHDLAIAYEPVWAIGTGQTATPADASAMCGMIKSLLRERDLGDPPVLYGGSVSAANAGSLIAAGNMDGFLVGGASLKPDDFLAIVEAASN
jgi:triosephosphate isomerase